MSPPGSVQSLGMGNDPPPIVETFFEILLKEIEYLEETLSLWSWAGSESGGILFSAAG